MKRLIWLLIFISIIIAFVYFAIFFKVGIINSDLPIWAKILLLG